MTPLLKGFMLGTVAVALALFFGFGGGVLVAEWLNDTPREQMRIGKINGTEKTAIPASEQSVANAANKLEPAEKLADENPLVPKRVLTEPVARDSFNKPPQVTDLPLSPKPMGPPQALTPTIAPLNVEPAPQASVSAQANPNRHDNINRADEGQVDLTRSTVRQAPERRGKRSELVVERVVKQQPASKTVQKRDSSSARKNAANKIRRDSVETTGLATHYQEDFDEEASDNRRLGRNHVREMRRSEGAQTIERSGPVLFGLFGL